MERCGTCDSAARAGTKDFQGRAQRIPTRPAWCGTSGLVGNRCAGPSLRVCDGAGAEKGSPSMSLPTDGNASPTDAEKGGLLEVCDARQSSSCGGDEEVTLRSTLGVVGYRQGSTHTVGQQPLETFNRREMGQAEDQR